MEEGWHVEYEDALDDILTSHWAEGHFNWGIPEWIYRVISGEMKQKTKGKFSERIIRDKFASLRKRYYDFKYLRCQPWYEWDVETNEAKIGITTAEWATFVKLYPFAGRYEETGERMYFTLEQVFRAEAYNEDAHDSSIEGQKKTGESSGSKGDTCTSTAAETEWSTNELSFRYFAPRVDTSVKMYRTTNPQEIRRSLETIEPRSSCNSNSVTAKLPENADDSEDNSIPF